VLAAAFKTNGPKAPGLSHGMFFQTQDSILLDPLMILANWFLFLVTRMPNPTLEDNLMTMAL